MKAFPKPNVQYQTGMDLRDYFAAHVISSLYPNHGYATAAKFAYQLADEMIKARNAK